MRNSRTKPLDLERVLDGWGAPEPPSGFAARVLAACDAPARPVFAVEARRPPARGPWLLAGALAAAVVLLPFVLLRSAPEPSQPVAVAVEPDLGTQHD